MPWDLLLIAVGSVAPVGHWWESTEQEFITCLDSNLILPMTLLQRLWWVRNEGAYVCWLAGSNPNMIMAGYSAYNISKMAVLKAVEQLDHESPDCTFFALGPGTILTKIHEATLNAGWDNPKLKEAMNGAYAVNQKHRLDVAAPIVYTALKWCIRQPKSVIGGRNFCTSDLEKYAAHHLDEELQQDPDMFKLRRMD